MVANPSECVTWAEAGHQQHGWDISSSMSQVLSSSPWRHAPLELQAPGKPGTFLGKILADRQESRELTMWRCPLLQNFYIRVKFQTFPGCSHFFKTTTEPFNPFPPSGLSRLALMRVCA